MKRIVTVQDISCFGKCSLTVALPVISAMGIETAVIPTAVLSTHTGGFKGYTFRDLTGDIEGIAQHWKSIGLKFNAIYTGYLGSKEQAEIVSKLFDDFSDDDTFIIVDPAMGDSGRLYAGFTDEIVTEMKKLCSKADFIIPNMTEASFMLSLPYTEDYDEKYIRDILVKLSQLGCSRPVLTGVRPDDRRHGAAAYDSQSGQFYFSFRDNINRIMHGTGDIFASVFTGAVTLGKSLEQSLEMAVGFTYDCITETLPVADEVWYGSCFESCLGKLIAYVNEK